MLLIHLRFGGSIAAPDSYQKNASVRVQIEGRTVWRKETAKRFHKQERGTLRKIERLQYCSGTTGLVGRVRSTLH
jgi:hypothetical protein